MDFSISPGNRVVGRSNPLCRIIHGDMKWRQRDRYTRRGRKLPGEIVCPMEAVRTKIAAAKTVAYFIRGNGLFPLDLCGIDRLAKPAKFYFSISTSEVIAP
jgi:hypothetical protein